MNIKVALSNINPYTFTFRKSQDTSKHNNLEKTPEKDVFEMSVGYVNDLHGQTNNMTRILSGIKGDLKLSAGDNDIGDEKNKAVNRAVMKFMNLAGISGSALGNHELDTKQKDFVDTINGFNGDYFAVNLKQSPIETQDPDDVEEQEHIELNKFIKKSSIIEVKGEKIGLIGAAPIDLTARVTHPSYHMDCSVEDLDDTIEDIQEQVQELKEQGVNKIFLLSHMGNQTDKIVAQKTQGIDVIIGGHTHELIKDVKEGENLLYSLTGEPVVITEAGKNGNYFGRLNLTFDKDGVITKIQNNLGETRLFQKNMINQYIINENLGQPEEVGYIKSVTPPPTTLIEENAHANFMCDAMRAELATDIAIWNNSGTRSFFQPGVIDSRDIKDIAPFEDRVSVADVSERKLVDFFKHAIEDTYRTQGNKPGLMAVSGMTYSVNPEKGILTGMSIIDKDGNEIKIDVDNPSDDKFYKVAMDSFMMFDGADFDILAPKEECINYPFNKDFLACEYIKHLNEPVVINQTGRIKFES